MGSELHTPLLFAYADSYCLQKLFAGNTSSTASCYESRVASKRRKTATNAEPLASFDRNALSSYLVAQTGRSHAVCSRAVSRCFRLVFRRDHIAAATWDDSSLQAAPLGQWVRPALLALTPQLSLRLEEEVRSRDGTRRLLLRAQDASLIEAVIIPANEGRDQGRTTLCVSSQVGCGRACTFCHTATLGLHRQLTTAEIIDQVRIAARLCTSARGEDKYVPATAAISNIVFMGMGEPFDNLEAVLRAVSLLTDPYAFAFAPSRITVSTVGVADRLPLFFASTRAELAISLNAVDDERREALMPINKRFNLTSLRTALLEHLPQTRRVLLQYVLFAGINDSLEDAQRLADFVAPIRCRVNVIPANPSPDGTLVAPPPQQVDAFVGVLSDRGVTTLVRRPRGRDVGGACGQLVGQRSRTPQPARDEQVWS